MKLTGNLLFAAVLMVVSGCSSSEDVPTPDEGTDESESVLEVLKAPELTSTIDLTDGERATVEGINEFSFKFFDAVANNVSDTYKGENSNNISVSPLGVALCLGMHANALDDSGTSNVLAMFGADNLTNYNSLSKKLISYLPYSRSEENEIVLANSAWLSENLKFSSSYLAALNSSYNSEVYNVDLSSDLSAELINAWCSKKTNDLIPGIPFSPNDYVGIDENGTTIAAVTALTALTSTGVTSEYEQVDMNVNRPFLYFVRNTVTGTIIMAGRVCNI